MSKSYFPNGTYIVIPDSPPTIDLSPQLLDKHTHKGGAEDAPPIELVNESFTPDIMDFLNNNLSVTGTSKYPLISVMDYGAVNDNGHTDNSRAFQQAYDDCQENGLIVVPTNVWYLPQPPQGDKKVLWVTNGAKDRDDNPLLLTGVQETFFQGRKLFGQAYGKAGDVAVIDIQRYCDYDGGTTGYVNKALSVATISSGNNEEFEWSILGQVQNSSTSQSQNVGVYGQGWAMVRDASNTWGGCFELRDTTGRRNPTKARVGIEVDNFGNGTDLNKVRVGIDIVNGRHDQGGEINWVAHGLRIGNVFGSDAEGIYENGITLNNQFTTGINLAPSLCTVGINTSTGHFVENAIRIGMNQSIGFDATGQHKIQWSGVGSTLVYSNGNTSLFEVVDNGEVHLFNSLHINGHQVISGGAVPSGYGTPTNGAIIGNYNGSNATLQQTSQMMAGLIATLQWHGLIR